MSIIATNGSVPRSATRALMIGRYIWTGSDLAQIATPALMALWVYFVGNAGMRLIRPGPGAATLLPVVLKLAFLCAALLWMMSLGS
jgi:hypothetical protein